MERELGIARYDLPHAYDEDRETSRRQICVCGRDERDALHDNPIQQAASHRAPAIETQKGT